MAKLSRPNLVFVAAALVLLLSAGAAIFWPRPQPPQFVVLTFDGGFELDMWARTLALSKEIPVHFTYFVSGAYFINKGDVGIEKTNIGFGLDRIPQRIEALYKAKASGHEIASHGATHFQGASRTEDAWKREFEDMDKITKTVVVNRTPLSYRGYRAPYLGWNRALLATVKASGMQYDSSQMWKESCLGLWPADVGGIFEFPIVQVRDDKNVLKSMMDFTTFDRDGNHPEKREEFRQQTLRMYRRVFERLYGGTRAPMIMLTHFGADRMNDNAYLLAMEDFAREVCTKPDVRCATIGETLDWMVRHPTSYPRPLPKQVSACAGHQR